MPLYKNTFQPFFLDPDSPAPVSCGEQYCNKVIPGDIIYQEWYQTPCAGSIVCDPEFEDFTVGAELIVNGNFPTNADDWFVNAVEVGATTCPANVDGWCYNTGKLGHDGTLGESAMVSQTGMGLIAGNIYRVIWTLQGRTQGNIYMQLGDGVGATQGSIKESDGTFTEFLFYNDAQDTISFVISEDFDGNIDSISLKLVTMSCWSGDYWSFDSGLACKTITGVQANLINTTTDYLVLGDYYFVEVTVQGIAGGSVSVYIDDGTDSTATNVQIAITSDGTYQYWITAGQNGVIAFDPTVDFVGCISTPSVQRLRNDFSFNLINVVGDSVALSSSVVYIENKVLLQVDFGALLEAGTIDYGCFTIQVTDTCLVSGDNLVQDGDFSRGDFAQWSRNSPAWQYQMVGGELQFIFDPLGDNPNLITNPNFAAGPTGWTGSPSWTITAAGATHVPGNTTPLSQPITIGTPAVAPAIRFTWWQVRITDRTAGSVIITVSDVSGTAISVNNTYTNVLLPTIGGVVTFAITPTSNFDGTIEFVDCSQVTRNWNSKPVVSNPANISVVQGNYQLEYEITAISGTTANTIGASASIRYPASGYVIDRTVAVHSHQELYTPGSTIIEIQGIFDLNGNFYPGTINVDDYSVVRIEPFEATYVSECFDFQPAFLNTTLVTGWCDHDNLGSTFEDALGFATTGFILQMRMEVRSMNPYIPTSGNNAFYGDGNAAVNYAQLEKYWQFVTDFISEQAHTTLAAMCRCDHFTIGEEGIAAPEYLAQMEDYQPAWRGEGDSNLAIGTVVIRKKEGGMKFMRHL